MKINLYLKSLSLILVGAFLPQASAPQLVRRSAGSKEVEHCCPRLNEQVTSRQQYCTQLSYVQMSPT